MHFVVTYHFMGFFFVLLAVSYWSLNGLLLVYILFRILLLLVKKKRGGIYFRKVYAIYK